MKLRKLLTAAEPLGDFMARVPGSDRQRNFPSTVAYIAQLVIHRYAMLGVLDENGFPVSDMGVLEVPDASQDRKSHGYHLQTGKVCDECGNAAMIPGPPWPALTPRPSSTAGNASSTRPYCALRPTGNSVCAGCNGS